MKYSFYLKFYAKELLGEEHQITQDLNKGWIPVSQEQLYAMFLQNMEAPRTSHRTQQITDGKYTYFNSNEDAVRWFTVRGEEEAKRIFQDLVKDEEKIKRDNLMLEKARAFAKTESMAEAAACLYGASIGKGETNFFYEELIANGGPNIAEKLKLLKKPIVGRTLITNDKEVIGHQNRRGFFIPSKHYKFQLWRNLVVKLKILSE